MSGENKGSTERARQFLAELERRCPASKELDHKQLLAAIKRVYQEGSLNMKQVVPEVNREIYGYSSDHDLINAVADLIPDEDRGNLKKAQQFLVDLERRRPYSKRLSNDQILSAIKNARREDSLELDRVVLEIRKVLYGYRGNPDRVREIYVPMGGKTR